MPSDNDKMLQALADSKSPGTDNQGITNVYNEQISVSEATTASQIVGGTAAGAGGMAAGAAVGSLLGPVGTVIGGVAGAALGGGASVKSSGSHNRSAVAMQRFLAGRGGGISQAVGKLLGAVGGTGYKRLQSDHSTMESANALYEGILGLLQRHENKLTGKQIKDYISNVDVPELAGGKVNIALLPVLDDVGDDMPYDADAIKKLFATVAEQIDDVIDTGGQRASEYTPVDINFTEMTEAVIAAILTYIATKGWWPKP